MNDGTPGLTPPGRLAFLVETVALEAAHLQSTDQRLFAEAHGAVPMLVRFVEKCSALCGGAQLGLKRPTARMACCFVAARVQPTFLQSASSRGS